MLTHTQEAELPIKKSDLDFQLPDELIAQQPCVPRDAARLMVIHRQSGRIEHRIFHELPKFLDGGDCLVINQTRVIPARFAARRDSGGRIPGLFLRQTRAGQWIVLLAGSGKVKIGETLAFENGPWQMQLLQRHERGECLVGVSPPGEASEILAKVGTPPLPPYIRRNALAPDDNEDYQTVYATDNGSVAAPTAGMHFTESLLKRIRADGIAIAPLTLHVGLGTFQPVEVDDLDNHPMHSEWYHLPDSTVEFIRCARSAKNRIVAVGTTVARVLESCASDESDIVRSGSGWTNILIQPPHRFRAIDCLITNFHLPGTTLMALVCAFAGRDLTMRAYSEAIGQRYHFYSYGDAMLIL